MIKKNSFADKVLEFNDDLSKVIFNLPNNYFINNPFNSDNKEKIKEITCSFYEKYYNDNNKRYLILGSSPSIKGTAVTGIPFEDANHLFEVSGIKIDNYYINKSNSNFLYEVMEKYGGYQKFYKDFYMSFVFPLGISTVNSKGNIVNCNYYDNKPLKNSLTSFIVENLRKQITLGIDTSICYCIGSGENFKFLNIINKQYNFFDKIISLEHPRFIMQYNSKDKEKYLNKYIEVFKNKD